LASNKFISTDDLALTAVRNPKGTLVHLKGRLNIDSSPGLRDLLLTLLQGKIQEDVSVDLAEVAYIDSSGLATLIEGLKIARQRNLSLMLSGLHGRLLHLFEVTGVLALFEPPHHPTDAPALEVPDAGSA